jgi:hypothetical protein
LLGLDAGHRSKATLALVSRLVLSVEQAIELTLARPTANLSFPLFREKMSAPHLG